MGVGGQGRGERGMRDKGWEDRGERWEDKG